MITDYTRRGAISVRIYQKDPERRLTKKILRWVYSFRALELRNLVDTYNPDIIIGTESWLREEIGNTEIFRSDFTTFRRDRHARGGGVFVLK